MPTLFTRPKKTGGWDVRPLSFIWSALYLQKQAQTQQNCWFARGFQAEAGLSAKKEAANKLRV
jgi:hydrogenase maturation factor